jgi:hypothetical protein
MAHTPAQSPRLSLERSGPHLESKCVWGGRVSDDAQLCKRADFFKCVCVGFQIMRKSAKGATFLYSCGRGQMKRKSVKGLHFLNSVGGSDDAQVYNRAVFVEL